ICSVRHVDHLALVDAEAHEVVPGAAGEDDDAVGAGVEMFGEGAEGVVCGPAAAAGGYEAFGPEVAHLEDEGDAEAAGHAVRGAGGEEVRRRADDDVGARSVRRKASEGAREREPVAG